MYLSVNGTDVASSYDVLLDLGTVPTLACYFWFSILLIYVSRDMCTCPVYFS